MDNKPCRTCGKPCETWDDLADHIKAQCKIKNDPHKEGLYWATDYIKDRRRRKLGTIGKKEAIRTPLTDKQRQNKEDSKWIISEKKKPATTYCPKCNHTTIQQIDIEYIESKNAVRTQQGILEVLCDSCRTK